MSRYARNGTVTMTNSPNSAASSGVPAWAFGPSSPTSSRSVSGPRELLMVMRWPSSMSLRARVPPMWPAPMIPMVVGAMFVMPDATRPTRISYPGLRTCESAARVGAPAHANDEATDAPTLRRRDVGVIAEQVRGIELGLQRAQPLERRGRERRGHSLGPLLRVEAQVGTVGVRGDELVPAGARLLAAGAEGDHGELRLAMRERRGIRRHVVHRPADGAHLEEVRRTAFEEANGVAGELGRDPPDEPRARRRLAL